MTEIVSTLLTSIGLGAGAGVNAYATFLVFGLVSRLMPGVFESDFSEFFAQTPVLIVMGVLYAIEFVADKIPAIDHAWDLVHTFIRPLAGAVVALAASSPEVPKSWVVMATILGGGAALGGHLFKSSVRGASTAVTGGVANPLISVAEDAMVIAGTLVAIFWPVFVIFALVLSGLLLIVIVRAIRRKSTVG